MILARVASRRTVALLAIALGAVALAVTALVTSRSGPAAAGAADHLDAPNLTPPGGDVRLDLTDVYAFRAPSGRAVLVMNVNGLTKKGKQATFATSIPNVAATKRASYNLRIDNNGDAKQDVVLGVTFGTPNAKGVQQVTVTRNGKQLLDGQTSEFGRVVINRSGSTRVFAGMREDPFFFDLDGFLNILSKEAGKSFLGCKSPRKDFFAGTNVSSIAIEIDSAQLTRAGSSMIGVWATTNLGSAQVDRMGRPAIATVFIPNNPFEPKGSEPSKKNTYNHTQPARDRATFKPEVVDSLKVLYSLNDSAGDDKSDDAGKIDGLADVLLPDILTFDTAKSEGFLNGRRLADDVIDAELNLVTEGAATSDCVSKNDVKFWKSFPYLAAPHK